MTLNKLSMLLLAAPLVLVGCEEGGGAPASRSAQRVDRPPFDGGAAFELLRQQVAFGPRVPGTEGHSRQLDWMTGLLAQRADTVVAQPFTYVTSYGDTLRLTNLLARFRPEAADRVLLITHWDTRPRADQAATEAERGQPIAGANDGASGTAVLLHLSELFHQQAPPIGVDLLFVDGEDYGPEVEDMLLGAKHFAANQPPGYPPLYGVLLDMVGDADPRFPVEGYSAQHAPEVVQRVWGVAHDLGYSDIFPNVSGGYVTDDHIPLNEGGIRTANVIDFDYGPANSFWHTPRDVPGNTSAETLGIVGDVIAELVYRGG